MALQISEIGIRLAVGAPASQPERAPHEEQRGGSLTPRQVDDLVQRCVREVLSSLGRLGDR